MSLSCRALCALTLLFAAGARSASAADRKHACVAASDRAQDERAQGHLGNARDLLLACAAQDCPGPVRAVCEEWLRQVEVRLPSVVVQVRDAAGHDVVSARVLVDGRRVANKLDGRAIRVDPGVHLFRFEADGHHPIEEQTLILEAEQNRILSVVLALEVTASVPSPSAPGVQVSSLLDPVSTRARVPAGTWILGATAVAAFGGFAYWTVSGSSDYARCATSLCSPSMQSSIDVRRVLAWTSLGVGVASLVGAGAVLAGAQRTTTVGLSPLPGGGLATAQGQF